MFSGISLRLIKLMFVLCFSPCLFPQVVQIETGPQEGATTYNVPLTSAIQFSPLYDPNDRIDEACSGFFFSTVGDMMAMKTLPKVRNGRERRNDV